MEENAKKVSLGGNKKQELRPQNRPVVNNTPMHTTKTGEEIPEEFLDTEFMTPTDEVPLPSQGIFYPNGQKSVEIKYLTAEDENILMSPELIRSGKVLDVLLENSIIDKTLNPKDMLVGDRNAVLFALRSTGYGDEYEVNMTCESCGESYKTEVVLSNLKSKVIEILPDVNGEYSVTLPKMKIDIKFRLLNGHDENRLSKASSSGNKKIGSNVKVPTTLTERYVLQIMEAKGNRDKTYIKKMVSAMPIADSMFLREYIKEVEPGVDMSYDFECPNCGHNQVNDIPITAKLFWPNANI